jgi:hypothetical protein
MPENVNKCPFSKAECRNCPIYRGRHSYIIPHDGEETPDHRVLKRPDYDWQTSFKQALQGKEKDVSVAEFEASGAEQQKTQGGGDGNESGKYEIALSVFYKETGERKTVTLDEAAAWDWENKQKVRSIGPWHIYSYQRLLDVLARKAEEGESEFELVEAPFYMGC